MNWNLGLNEIIAAAVAQAGFDLGRPGGVGRYEEFYFPITKIIGCGYTLSQQAAIFQKNTDQDLLLGRIEGDAVKEQGLARR